MAALCAVPSYKSVRITAVEKVISSIHSFILVISYYLVCNEMM